MSVVRAPACTEARNVRGFDLPHMYARRAVLLAGRPPLIGVSTSEMRAAARTHALDESEPPMRELALGLAYPRSLERTGAIPVVLPPMDLEHVDALLDRLGRRGPAPGAPPADGPRARRRAARPAGRADDLRRPRRAPVGLRRGAA